MDQGADKRAAFRRAVYGLFSNDLMIMLALLLVPAILFPFFLPFSNFTLGVFSFINYFVILMFIAEYCLKLAAAENRLTFFLNPWHILDLAIVVLALLDFVPIIPGGGRFAPLLRLVRVVYLFAVAGRAVKRAAPPHRPLREMPRESRLKIHWLDRNLSASAVGREEAGALLRDNLSGWLDLQDVSELDLDFISGILGVPAFELQGKVLRETFPQIDYFPAYTSILIRDSRMVSPEDGIRDIVISRGGILIVCSADRVVTVSSAPNRLFDRVLKRGLRLGDEGFGLRVLYSILKLKNRDYEEITDTLEQKTIILEEEPMGRLKKSFLEETFLLKREITNVHNNLRHFSQVQDALQRKKPTLASVRDEHLPLFKNLSEEAAYLHETADNTRERVVSLIEFYINTVSLDMNRVMRVLAVITCLGLIPAIIGGLLGMNLIDQPWHARIYEIAILVFLGVVVGFYFFWKKGWIR